VNSAGGVARRAGIFSASAQRISFAFACDPEVSPPLISPAATGSGETQLPITPFFRHFVVLPGFSTM